jgi:hypothetical protein
MVVMDTYSKRMRKNQHHGPVNLLHDQLPKRFRTQFIYIIQDVFGDDIQSNQTFHAYDMLVKLIREELGKLSLRSKHTHRYLNPAEELCEWFTKEEDVLNCLDTLEISCKFIDRYVREYPYNFPSFNRSGVSIEDILEKINVRLQESGSGYKYEGQKIIRIDSEYLHSEVTQGTIRLLGNKIYAGAEEEFHKALDCFKKGEASNCLGECLKAFESTMKIICEKRGWRYNDNYTAKKLIELILKNELIPSYLQEQFTSLRTLLESGIPTTRNRLAGHGRGNKPHHIPEYLPAYQLHMTATTIRMLVQAEQELPQQPGDKN